MNFLPLSVSPKGRCQYLPVSSLPLWGSPEGACGEYRPEASGEPMTLT